MIDKIVSSAQFVFWSGLASILGFGLSLWVLWTVRKIRGAYVFKARIPELKDRLDEAASKLSKLLNAYDKSVDEVDIAIGELNVLFGSVSSKTEGETRRRARDAGAQTKTYGNYRSRENAHQVYVAARSLATALEQLLRDRNWE